MSYYQPDQDSARDEAYREELRKGHDRWVLEVGSWYGLTEALRLEAAFQTYMRKYGVYQDTLHRRRSFLSNPRDHWIYYRTFTIKEMIENYEHYLKSHKVIAI